MESQVAWLRHRTRVRRVASSPNCTRWPNLGEVEEVEQSVAARQCLTPVGLYRKLCLKQQRTSFYGWWLFPILTSRSKFNLESLVGGSGKSCFSPHP